MWRAVLLSLVIILVYGIPISSGVLGVRLAAGAKDILRGINQRPELLNAPYSPHIRPTQHIAFAFGILGVIWAVVVCPVPVLFGFMASPGVGVIIFIGIHLILACSLLVASILQAAYMPHPLNRCYNVDRWDFSGEKPSLFQVLATAKWGQKEDTLEPQEVCNIFLKVWRIEMALMVIWFLVVILGLVFAFFLMSESGIWEGFALPFHFIFRYYEKRTQHRRTTHKGRAERGLSVSSPSNDVSL